MPCPARQLGSKPARASSRSSITPGRGDQRWAGVSRAQSIREPKGEEDHPVAGLAGALMPAAAQAQDDTTTLIGDQAPIAAGLKLRRRLTPAEGRRLVT